MFTLLLKYIRDARLVWDIMGPVYNRRIYDAIAELYDHIVLELEPVVEAMILDAGTGRGYLSLMLAAQNPQSFIIGIDYSPMQIRAAGKDKSPTAPSSGTMSWTSGSMTTYSMPSSAWDQSNTGPMV
jgi:2-polyprenyl-3-methyl-5-hydroxy-6-metoxy-1,4-benzoquinol methylase